MKKPVKRHAVTQPDDKSIRLIALTKGQNAIVDAEDYEWLNQWNWHAQWEPSTNSFYVTRTNRYQSICMHRVILGCAGKEQADHKNHNTLDNRRHNLRKCTQTQNMHNTRRGKLNKSGVKGVCFYKRTRKWRAQIGLDGKRKYLGDFSTVEDAARAYDLAAKQLRGEFSNSTAAG